MSTEEKDHKIYIDDNGLVLKGVSPRYANKDNSLNINTKLIYCECLYKDMQIRIDEIITHDNGNKYCKFRNDDNKIMWVLMEGISTTSVWQIKNWRVPYCRIYKLKRPNKPTIVLDMHDVVVYTGGIVALSFIAAKFYKNK